MLLSMDGKKEIRMLSNLKDFKTSAIGLLTLIATLPQSGAVQSIISISPKAANYVTGVAGVAAGLLLIFGINTKK